MTASHFTIDTDVARRLMRLTLRGDWDVAVTRAFAGQVAAAFRGMLAQGGVHGEMLTLIDMREKNILPQDVAREMGGLIRPGSPSKRIALVVSGMLHLMQAKRITVDPRCAFFTDEGEAVAWLMETAPLAALE